jgi:hypothetical protein
MNANTPEVKVGDTVLFVPGADHRFDKDRKSEQLFHFEHTHDAPNSSHSYKKGDRVQNHGTLGAWQQKQGDSIRTQGGHTIRPTKPRMPWNATVREVLADGTLALDIAHPRGYTLHYPRHDILLGGVRHSATGEPHTWHLSGEEPAAAL